jgi:hypothetical protein
VSRFVFIAAIICAAPAFAGGPYFAAIDDLPLPPGFVERDAGASFESGAGRIVLANAEGEMPLLAVRDFYYDSLPPLGWSESPQPDGVLVFQRGRERLSFTVERAGSRTRLGARLVIMPASMNAD